MLCFHNSLIDNEIDRINVGRHKPVIQRLT